MRSGLPASAHFSVVLPFMMVTPDSDDRQALQSASWLRKRVAAGSCLLHSPLAAEEFLLSTAGRSKACFQTVACEASAGKTARMAAQATGSEE